jgi:mannose-6-phosphate isomerase-like protein (cupin superfamily)
VKVFNIENTKRNANTDVLTSYMLISPQNAFSKNLSIQLSFIPIGSEQPIHAHEPEQVYYIVKGQGLMSIDNESREVSAGDSILIPSNSNHGMKNIGNKTLEYLTANSPVFQKEYEDSLWSKEPH